MLTGTAGAWYAYRGALWKVGYIFFEQRSSYGKIAEMDIEKHFLENQVIIEKWFDDQWHRYQPILTSSIDLRNAGYKMSVVDTNLFPAGYNNLSAVALKQCQDAFYKTIHHHYSECKKIVLIPEGHTRNKYYFESFARLFVALQLAGFEVRAGSLNGEKSYEIPLYDNVSLRIETLDKIDQKILIKEYVPQLIILNNDLSDAFPNVLKDIIQPIEPPPRLGWAYRSKNFHFKIFREYCQELAALIQIDPWRLFALHEECDNVDFMNRDSMEPLIEKTEQLLKRIQQKYDEYKIALKPFVVIKADAGTYGMAVMSVRSAEGLRDLNRKQRMSMITRKGGHLIYRFIIQEGIPSIDRKGSPPMVAEPVLYLVGASLVGGFYRCHPSRGEEENLNSPGMQFQACSSVDLNYAYSVMARLGTLSASRERALLLTK